MIISSKKRDFEFFLKKILVGRMSTLGVERDRPIFLPEFTATHTARTILFESCIPFSID